MALMGSMVGSDEMMSADSSECFGPCPLMVQSPASATISSSQ